LSESGIPMYQVGVHRFDISAFETSDYLVYFISDLDKQHNTQLMLALAPQVQGFFARLELRLSSCLQFRFFMSKPVVVVIPRSAR
jgi:hypothetical protein